ncbi:unnamed protein product [Acidithrix sp. C25]|nr:unnamed protein product [Acidithrix sp. C25]
MSIRIYLMDRNVEVISIRDRVVTGTAVIDLINRWYFRKD